MPELKAFVELAFERAPSGVNAESAYDDDEWQIFDPPRIAALRTSETRQSLYTRRIRHPDCLPPDHP